MAISDKQWGSSRSHKKLDQRLAAIRTRLVAAGQGYPVGIDPQIERMRRAMDEEGVRKAAEAGERAAAIVEKTKAGGPELLEYLRGEFAAGRLNPGNMEAFSDAVDHFQWRKRRAPNARQGGVKNIIRVFLATLLVSLTFLPFGDGVSWHLHPAQWILAACWLVFIGTFLVKKEFRLVMMLMGKSGATMAVGLPLVLCIIVIQAYWSGNDGPFSIGVVICFIVGLPAALAFAWFLWDERQGSRRLRL